jgi:hypothetical protein
MFPPVFQLAVASTDVTDLLGTAPTRLFPFGKADQANADVPYAVWQTVTGAPANFLGNRPDADSFRIQIDVYGNSAAEVRSVAEALRDAYETSAYIVRWGGETIDNATEHYRYSFDVDFIIQR